MFGLFPSRAKKSWLFGKGKVILQNVTRTWTQQAKSELPESWWPVLRVLSRNTSLCVVLEPGATLINLQCQNQPTGQTTFQMQNSHAIKNEQPKLMPSNYSTLSTDFFTLNKQEKRLLIFTRSDRIRLLNDNMSPTTYRSLRRGVTCFRLKLSTYTGLRHQRHTKVTFQFFG